MMGRKSSLCSSAALAAILLATQPAAASMEKWITTFERLLGGLKVHDKQRSGSSSQTQQVIKKSDEATVNAIMDQERAYRLADIKARYGYESGQGATACLATERLAGLTGTESSQARVLKSYESANARYFSSGGDAAANMQNSLLKRIGHYCTLEERNALGSLYCRSGVRNERGAGDSNAGPFLLSRNYGAQEVVQAGDYIDVLAPLPTIDPNKRDVGGTAALIEARMRAAALSGARSAMMGVAVSGMGGDR